MISDRKRDKLFFFSTTKIQRPINTQLWFLKKYPMEYSSIPRGIHSKMLPLQPIPVLKNIQAKNPYLKIKKAILLAKI